MIMHVLPDTACRYVVELLVLPLLVLLLKLYAHKSCATAAAAVTNEY